MTAIELIENDYTGVNGKDLQRLDAKSIDDRTEDLEELLRTIINKLEDIIDDSEL